MKYLFIPAIILLIASCSKFEIMDAETTVEGDDQIVFSSRSNSPKKGNFRGHLCGSETNATGQVNFKFEGDNSTIFYKLIVANIEDVTAAHLHHAHMGNQPGHTVLTLFSGMKDGRMNGVSAEGVLTEDDINCDCGNPDHHTLARLRSHIENGETSVLVHTEKFPHGEISGGIY